MPILNPLTTLQRHACATLTLNVIDWIRRYEVTVIERLGIEYRRRTLLPWNNGNRHFTPAEKFASAWRLSSLQVGANFDIFLRARRYVNYENATLALYEHWRY
ncbi:MAG: hypothetical protein GY904_29075 [Planctomycetaceae bacterium]|nr:hypothetical protein [Planctomycetaceae bacterium]